MRFRRPLWLGILLCVVAMPVGAKSKLVMTWRNSEVKGAQFHKILIIGMSDKTDVRADFEDTLSTKIARPGLEAVPGNTILLRPEGSKTTLDYVRSQVIDNHIDSVIVSRLVKVDKNITYVPGQVYSVPYGYYNTFYGYYGNVYPIVYSPGYLREEKKVRVETNLYSTATGEGVLVWTGMSDTFNPSSPKKAIDGIVKVVVKELEKERLLGPKP
jgi:hypothetical protein